METLKTFIDENGSILAGVGAIAVFGLAIFGIIDVETANVLLGIILPGASIELGRQLKKIKREANNATKSKRKT